MRAPRGGARIARALGYQANSSSGGARAGASFGGRSTDGETWGGTLIQITADSPVVGVHFSHPAVAPDGTRADQ